MSQDALQNDDVSPGHHKVTGEAVSQYMTHLLLRQLNACQTNDAIKLAIALVKITVFPILQFVIQFIADWYRAILFPFGIDGGEFIRGKLSRL